MKRCHWVVVATVLSCGSRAEEGETSRDEPIDMSPQSVCAFYAERDCARWQACNAPDVRFFYGDIATCKERSALSCVSRLAATGTNETPSNVVQCAKAVAGLPCESYLDFERWPESCTIPPGNLQDGTGCVAPVQCQSGHCAISNKEACGVCKTVSRAGETCSAPSDCLYLMPCVNGVCVPHPNLGEPCDAGERACVAGSACRNIDASGLGICEKLLPADAACDPQAPAGEECDYTQWYACDTRTRTCLPTLDRPGGIGAKCVAKSDCDGVSFCEDQLCKARPRDGELCVAGVKDCVFPARCIGGICTMRDPAVCQ